VVEVVVVEVEAPNSGSIGSIGEFARQGLCI